MKLFSKNEFLALLDEELGAIEENKMFNILISGGRSVEFVLTYLKQLNMELKKKITLIVSDERLVSWDSDESNSGSLMRKLGTEFAFVTPYLGKKVSLENAKKSYKDIDNIDFAILGVGEDGHVASLFPRNSGTYLSNELMLVKHSPKPPSERVSVSYEFISRSKRGCVLIVGKEKSHLLTHPHMNLPFQRLIEKLGFICTTDLK